jgi:hypothetical protein
MDLGQQIISVIRPDSLGDLAIYLIFILSIIALATIPEKNVLSPYLMYVVLLCCVIDLVRGAGAVPGGLNRFQIGGESLLSNNGFITFLMHIIMFTFPLVAGGMVRRQGRKGGLALPMCLLVGLIGGVYALASFFAPALVYNKIF